LNFGDERAIADTLRTAREISARRFGSIFVKPARQSTVLTVVVQ